VIVVIAALGIATAVSHLRSEKAKVAREAYYVATQAYEQELKALTPTPAPTPVPSKDKKAAPVPAAPKDEVEYQQMDVAKSFPKTLAALDSVLTNHKGTLAAFQAEMLYGNLYMDHGSAASAVPHYAAAVTQAPEALEKMSALFSLAEAQESSNQCADAVKSIDQALATGVATLKGDLLVTQARCYETLKDSAQAKKVYDRIVMELPNTPFAKIAEMQRAKH
jgi:tetratricopeptide (TPR) repeat protein